MTTKHDRILAYLGIVAALFLAGLLWAAVMN